VAASGTWRRQPIFTLFLCYLRKRKAIHSRQRFFQKVR